MSRYAPTLAAAAAVAALALGGWSLAPREAPGALRLRVEDARRDQVLHERPVPAGARVALGYVHSVSRTRVRGLFEVRADGALIARETSFGTFGPGLPALQPGDRYEIRDGAIRQLDLDQVLDGISVFVHPETDHVLEVAGEMLSLSRVLPPGTLVRIRAHPGPVRRVGRAVSRWTEAGPAATVAFW